MIRQFIAVAISFFAIQSFSQQYDKIKIFPSQAGGPLKAVQHEVQLSATATGKVELKDGDLNIFIIADYLYSLNNQLQVGGGIALTQTEGYSATLLKGLAIYNFGPEPHASKAFAGGGVIISTGDAPDTMYLFGRGGKRFSLTRHLAYAPYAEIMIPLDTDKDKSSISAYPLVITALF